MLKSLHVSFLYPVPFIFEIFNFGFFISDAFDNLLQKNMLDSSDDSDFDDGKADGSPPGDK